MMIDTPSVLKYFITEDIYLLKNEQHAASPIELAVPEAIPATTFNFMGEPDSGFLIVCYYPGLDFVDEKHLAALTNTLQRKDIAIGDVTVFNIAGYPNIKAAEIMGFFKPKRMLLLGELALVSDLGPVVLNKISVTGACKTLYTFSFAEMMGDRDKTKAFWEQMKVL